MNIFYKQKFRILLGVSALHPLDWTLTQIGHSNIIGAQRIWHENIMEEQTETGGLVPHAEQEMEDESITRLKALRGANRGVLTRLENETLDLIARSENG